MPYQQDDPFSWYTQRHVDVPIEDAIPALDVLAWHATLRPSSPYARVLGRAVPDAGPAPPGTPSRSFAGRLGLRIPAVAVPVELNLTAWSRTVSSLGLRPAGRRRPALHRHYFAGTHAFLDDIAMKLDLLVHLNGGPHSDAARHYALALVVSATTPAVPRLTYAPR